MENKPQITQLDCHVSEKNPKELEAEGWEQFYIFHGTNPEQFALACQRVNDISRDDWDVFLVNDPTKLGKKNGVQYLYIKKTASRDKWDRGKGY